MPALTVANLLAWFIQVGVLVVVAGVAIRIAAPESPRVKLACARAVLVVCLILPFAAATASNDQGVSTPGARSARTDGNEPALASLSVDVSPAAGRQKVGAGTAPSNGTSRFGLVVPPWIMPALLVVLAAGVAIRLAWLSLGLVALGRLRRQAGYATFRRHGHVIFDRDAEGGAIADAIALTGVRAQICTSSAVTHPVTFGLVRPIVLLPSNYSSLEEPQQIAVVSHELLHVRRRDWLHTISEEIVRAVLWFHPAIWWLLAQIDLSREQAVDQEVVALTERRQPYVNALVALARMPAGPILRPASLFLGRAHLLQRVALLSREVRMSRPRLVISVGVIAAAVVFGGQFVVRAFPLSLGSLPAPPSAPLAPAAAVQQTRPPRVPPPPPAPQGAQFRTTPKILQRAEPIVAPRPGQAGEDLIVAMQVTIEPSGEMTRGPVEALSKGAGAGFATMTATGTDYEQMLRGLDRLDGARTTDLRAAFDALSMWRFEPASQPFKTVVGFNLTRTEQSGVETEPVRIGRELKMPVKVRDVKPVYPDDAVAKGIQGVVILELEMDGAGIPVSAFALRPVEGLTMAAVKAALQWRFTPDPNYSRRLMTVTVNFTLAGSSTGVVGGVSGGVVGGVSGGVGGGVAGAPQYSGMAPLRVGGSIQQPTRTRYVEPVYPQVAQQARVRGVVILEVVIGPDGKVQDAKILRSIPLLDQAAIDAVKQWEYTPTLLNGTPVPVIMTVTASFPGTDSGVSGTVSGGVAGGVVGGIVGGIGGAVPDTSSFGPPRSEWPDPVRVGGDVRQPTKIQDVKAVYPPVAQDARVQGVVIVEILVGTDGKVQAGRILRSIPLLDQAAMDAVSQWEFTPTLVNGAPVPVVMTVTVNFTLM